MIICTCYVGVRWLPCEPGRRVAGQYRSREVTRGHERGSAGHLNIALTWEPLTWSQAKLRSRENVPSIIIPQLFRVKLVSIYIYYILHTLPKVIRFLTFIQLSTLLHSKYNRNGVQIIVLSLYILNLMLNIFICINFHKMYF